MIKFIKYFLNSYIKLNNGAILAKTWKLYKKSHKDEKPLIYFFKYNDEIKAFKVVGIEEGKQHKFYIIELYEGEY